MGDIMNTVASVRDLEEALGIILSNNFDADSCECVKTLIRMLDNLLHKPHDPKVRTIRLGNAAFNKKVGSRKGGIEFVQACGFQRQTAAAPLLSAQDSGEEQLVLVNESQSHLVTARRLLSTRAVQDLGVNHEELPVFRPPPLPTSVQQAASSSADFNPYAGHRFDAKSAAVGANLGPDSNYVSTTETELSRLKNQQAALERKRKANLDPSWRAFRPNEPVVVRSIATNKTAAKQTTDASLIAGRLKRQQEAQKQRSQFTTKAMRDLARIKNQKVYSHATLTVHFPDGHNITGQFVPTTSIAAVKERLVKDCFLEGMASDFDLYITPPRRVLQKSLQEEDLVPAAKIFVSWQRTPSSAYLQPHLFDAAATAAFPAGQSIVEEHEEQDKKPEAVKKAPVTKESKEDALLRRMMGRTTSMMSGGGGKKLGGKP